MCLAVTMPRVPLSMIVQGVRSAQGLAAQSVEDLALGLLSEFSVRDDVISRRNTINAVCQQLGLGGPSRRAASRVLAESWQLLEHRGLICRDPDQTQGDWWFLTRAGQAFLAEEDAEIALFAAMNPDP